jgi:import inner membrane translocase subunit TIM50
VLLGALLLMRFFPTALVIFGVPDTRKVLGRYRGQDVPLEWAKVEAQNKARHVKEWEAKQAQLGGLATGGWTMGRITGSVRTFHPPRSCIT